MRSPFLLLYCCSWGTWHEAREEQTRLNTRFASTLVIAAAIIVAVRLARDDISEPTPRVRAAIGQSINLACLILIEVVYRCPGA